MEIRVWSNVPIVTVQDTVERGTIGMAIPAAAIHVAKLQVWVREIKFNVLYAMALARYFFWRNRESTSVSADSEIYI